MDVSNVEGDNGQAEQSVKPTKEAPTLTADAISDIFVLSFRFSQGSEALQELLFKYIKATNPELQIPYESREAIEKLAIEKISPLFNFTVRPPDRKYYPRWAQENPLHTINDESRMTGKLSPGDVDFQAYDRLRRMAEICDAEPESIEALIPEITTKIIDSDYRNLVSPRTSRPREAPDNNPNSVLKDPYASFFIEYAMRGKKTGREEFNKMHEKIKAHTEEQIASQSTVWTETMRPKLAAVTEKYNAEHPKNTYVLAA